MPRPKAAVQANPPNSMVASAARLGPRKANVPKGGAVQAWQTELWGYLDSCGEYASVNLWIANALSRVRLRVMETRPDGTQGEVTTGDAADILANLFDGETGQTQMLHTMAMHLNTPGETYLVGVPADDTDPFGRDQWRVLSNLEIRPEGATWVIDRGDGDVERYKMGRPPRGDDMGEEPEALVIRIWRPHPRMWVEATSPGRAALPTLRELAKLGAYVNATLDSRLAGAGILFVPSEMSFSTPDQADVPVSGSDLDAFMKDLTEAMLTPLADHENAAARVPIVIKAPGALLANIKHISFETTLSAENRALREENRGTLAITLDAPPEVLTGKADINHWGAWIVDEDAIKLHIEPLVELIVNALTTRYLWPALQAGSPVLDPGLRRFTIDGDTSALRQRPDHSADAKELHKVFAISDKALLRETGFDSGDAPDPAELQRRLLMETATGVTTADVTVAALAQLGVTLVPKPSEVDAPTAPRAIGSAPSAPPAAVEPAPVEQRRTPPESQQAAALLASGELMVLRAVERANNRVNRRSKTPKPMPATALDEALAGAWDHAPRAAALCGVPEATFTAALDRYTRALLTQGTEHNPTVLMRLLQEEVLTAPYALTVVAGG